MYVNFEGVNELKKKIITITIAALILFSILPIFNQNYSSATTSDPAKIKLYIGPNKLPADGNAYNCVYVQLLDSHGLPARAKSYVTISLSSSKAEVGTVDSSITIPYEESFGMAKFYTNASQTGTTTITATATDYATVQGTVTTSLLGTEPTKLMVYCSPSMLPADGKTYGLIQVQFQDSTGKPTPATAETYVNMFSSETSVATLGPLLAITAGKTQGTGSITVTNAEGTTTITAELSDYVTGKATLKTSFIDLLTLRPKLSIASSTLMNGNKTQITASITADGNPITGATVKFASNNGGTFTTVKEQTGGNYTTTFTAPSFAAATECTITATASKNEYSSGQVTAKITVSPTPPITLGNLQFCIIDEDQNSVSDVTVVSIVQPTEQKALVGLTNSTGYVKFTNITSGTYTFRVSKDGYKELNQTIRFTSKSPPLTLQLTKEETINNNALFIVSIVATAVIVAVLITVLLVRRRQTVNIDKLKQLQKQLAPKFEEDEIKKSIQENDKTTNS
jgi:hypothetical protein